MKFNRAAGRDHAYITKNTKSTKKKRSFWVLFVGFVSCVEFVMLVSDPRTRQVRTVSSRYAAPAAKSRLGAQAASTGGRRPALPIAANALMSSQ